MRAIHGNGLVLITTTLSLIGGTTWCQAQPADSAKEKIVTAIERPAPKPFTPMTGDERLHYYIKKTFSPEALVRSAAGAGIGQWKDRPEEWMEGGEGFGRRFLSSYAQHVAQTDFELAASSLLREDNRYFVSERTGKLSRTLYAIESPFLSRHRDGTRHASFSHIGAVIGAAMLSRVWQPHSTRSLTDAGLSAVTSVSVSMGFDVAREFWPRK